MTVSGNGRTVADVAVDLSLDCVDPRGRHHEIATVVGYRRADPYAVTMTFITGEGDLTWTFGRDLLARGLSEAVGVGDVRVAPALDDAGSEVVHIELTSPDGHLLLRARAAEVSDFVHLTLALVPAGEESQHLDLDLLLARLLDA
jgi:hypothetical protein